MKLQIKATMEEYCTSFRMANVQNTETPSATKDMEQEELSFISRGQTSAASSENSLSVSYKKKHTLTI